MRRRKLLSYSGKDLGFGLKSVRVRTLTLHHSCGVITGTFLCLGFSVCKLGIIKLTSEDYGEDYR